MKQNVANQKPYTEESPEFLDALATKNKNVCVYGYGSKIRYLRKIVSDYFSDHHVWEVNGFRNTLSQKKVYNNFGKFLVDIGLAPKITQITRADQLTEYRQILKNAKLEKPLVVLFHCIDSLHFLGEDEQLGLSNLFSLPNIKLICSL